MTSRCLLGAFAVCAIATACRNGTPATPTTPTAHVEQAPPNPVDSRTRRSSAEDDVAMFPDIGFSITKPPDWHYLATAPHKPKFENVPEEWANRIQTTEPLVVIAKQDAPLGPENPFFKVVFRPLRSLSWITPHQLAEMTYEAMVDSIPGAERVGEIEAVDVSGLPAASMAIAYTLPDDQGVPAAMISRVWCAKRGSNVFLIGAGGPAEGSDADWEGLDQIFASIWIRSTESCVGAGC